LKIMQPLSVTAKTLVNACGHGAEAIHDALSSNRTGLAEQSYPNLNFSTWLGKTEGIDDIELEKNLSRYHCRNNQLACLALDTDNFRHSVTKAIDQYGAQRIGLFVGTSTSGCAETENGYRYARQHDGNLPDDYELLYTHNIGSLQDYVQRSLGLNGPGHTISTACSSSTKVFAAAYRHIASGQCDAAVVGGVDSLCLSTLYGFNSLQLISDDVCRPYDLNRKGINIGEAAGFVLLERVEAGHGKVKLKGYGESSDAFHMSSPHPDGDGAVQAMVQSLAKAGLDASDIGYLNLHGTATRNNDKAEARAVERVFGDMSSCSSTKGFTGHTLGAAGITEAIISILALEESILPGNLNLTTSDPELAIQPFTQTTDHSVENVMSNNFGFGGSNCSVIFGW